MNKQRRKSIQTVIYKLEELQSEFETLLEEEQDYYDNMPDSFQQGEKGDKSQEAIDNLQSIIDSICDAIENANQSME